MTTFCTDVTFVAGLVSKLNILTWSNISITIFAFVRIRVPCVMRDFMTKRLKVDTNKLFTRKSDEFLNVAVASSKRWPIVLTEGTFKHVINENYM